MAEAPGIVGYRDPQAGWLVRLTVQGANGTVEQCLTPDEAEKLGRELIDYARHLRGDGQRVDIVHDPRREAPQGRPPARSDAPAGREGEEIAPPDGGAQT